MRSRRTRLPGASAYSGWSQRTLPSRRRVRGPSSSPTWAMAATTSTPRCVTSRLHFPEGNGTKSEVAFALALGRPVVLVGSAWDTVFPPGEDREAREALIESAKKRVEGDHSTALGVLVTQAYDDLLEADVRVERYELDHPAAEIVAAARGLAGDDDAGLVGDLPMLTDRPDLDPLADQYRDWLAGVDRDR